MSDSGLEPYELEPILMIDGRRVGRCACRNSNSGASMTHLLRLFCCASAIAEAMDDGREPQALAAGVLAADCGVIAGVGRGAIRAKAGVGGITLGLGSRNRGRTVAGVGVES